MKWQTQGKDPDYRFSLANERTFLAWVRTALALLAAGVLLDQFATQLAPAVVVVWAAVTLAIMSAAISGAAYFRWKGNEIAMRLDQPLPHSGLLAMVSIGLLLVSITMAALLWWN